MAIGLVSAALIAGKMKSAWDDMSHDPAETVAILLADKYIPAFTVIQPEDVRAAEIPKIFVPPGTLGSVQELKNESGQKIFVSAVAIPQDHPLTRTLLIDASRGEALGALIGPGRVAVSFELDRARGVGGWIKPGDALAIFTSSALKPRLLFSSMLVLAVDSERLGEKKNKSATSSSEITMPPAFYGENGAHTITVLAWAREAPMLMEARDAGSLSVVLRSPGDDRPWPAEK